MVSLIMLDALIQEWYLSGSLRPTEQTGRVFARSFQDDFAARVFRRVLADVVHHPLHANPSVRGFRVFPQLLHLKTTSWNVTLFLLRSIMSEGIACCDTKLLGLSELTSTSFKLEIESLIS